MSRQQNLLALLIVVLTFLLSCGDEPIELTPPRDAVAESIFQAEWNKECRERHRGAPNIDCYCDGGEPVEGC